MAHAMRLRCEGLRSRKGKLRGNDSGPCKDPVMDYGFKAGVMGFEPLACDRLGPRIGLM